MHLLERGSYQIEGDEVDRAFTSLILKLAL
jgi:hypothetical protein